MTIDNQSGGSAMDRERLFENMKREYLPKEVHKHDQMCEHLRRLVRSMREDSPFFFTRFRMALGEAAKTGDISGLDDFEMRLMICAACIEVDRIHIEIAEEMIRTNNHGEFGDDESDT